MISKFRRHIRARSGTYYLDVAIADVCCFKMMLDTGAWQQARLRCVAPDAAQRPAPLNNLGERDQVTASEKDLSTGRKVSDEPTPALFGK